MYITYKGYFSVLLTFNALLKSTNFSLKEISESWKENEVVGLLVF